VSAYRTVPSEDVTACFTKRAERVFAASAVGQGCPRKGPQRARQARELLKPRELSQLVGRGCAMSPDKPQLKKRPPFRMYYCGGKYFLQPSQGDWFIEYAAVCDFTYALSLRDFSSSEIEYDLADMKANPQTPPVPHLEQRAEERRKRILEREQKRETENASSNKSGTRKSDSSTSSRKKRSANANKRKGQEHE